MAQFYEIRANYDRDTIVMYQVGLNSQIIEEYVNQWIVKIEDLTPTVRKLHNFIKTGNMKNFNRLLPKEKIYTVPNTINKRLLIK